MTMRRRHWQKQKKERNIFMTKPGDSQTKKTIGMGHNHPPNEGEEQDNPTLWELAKEHKISYADAVPIQENMRLKKEAKIEAAKIKKDVTEMDKLKKRAEEAEGELSIMKGIETNRVKEAQAKSGQLQDQLDRSFKENNNLYNRIADLTESLKSRDYFEKPDYKYLIEENIRLEEEKNELLIVNKRLNKKAEEQLARARKAGL